MRALTALLLAGCALDPTLAQTGQAIIDGTDDAGRDPSVVSLLIDTGSATFFSCTATVVTPRIVLTAAHCTDIPGATRMHVEFFESWNFQTGVKTGVVDPQGRTVVDKWVDPEFNDILVLEGLGHDVALLLLDAPVPESLVPVPFYRSFLTQALVGQTDRFVGFGDRSEDAGNDPLIERQYASVTIGSIDDQHLRFGGQASNTCHGDSGGPHLITVDGVEYVAAVTSIGSSSCAAESFNQRIDENLDAMIQFIDANDPQPTASCGKDGICGWNCPDIDPDCPCIIDGRCDAQCPVLDSDPDCPANCDADGVCQRIGCPRHDPDCGTTAIGGACTSNVSCLSDLCAPSGAAMVCSQPCDPNSPCPSGFECANDAKVCLAETPTGGGCQIGQHGGGSLLVGLLLLLVATRQRRLRAE